MFAQLGDIQFNLIPYFESLDTSKTFDYAEHKVIEGKPRLQFVGDGLDCHTIDIVLHSQYCSPDAEYKKLADAASGHQALAFVFGNGSYKGRYVITELSASTRQTDPIGNIISLGARLSLKEWVEAQPLESKKQQQKANAKGLKKKGATPKPTAKTGYTTQTVTNQQGYSVKKIVRQE